VAGQLEGGEGVHETGAYAVGIAPTLLQPIEWTAHALSPSVQHVRVDHRC